MINNKMIIIVKMVMLAVITNGMMRTGTVMIGITKVILIVIVMIVLIVMTMIVIIMTITIKIIYIYISI